MNETLAVWRHCGRFSVSCTRCLVWGRDNANKEVALSTGLLDPTTYIFRTSSQSIPVARKDGQS